MRFFFDWLPIILFFVVFKYSDIYYATATAMISSVILIGFQKIFRINIEKIQLVSLAMIVFFGSLTILLQDEQFIKLKPTVLYLVLALVLFVPQFFNKYLIKNLLEKQISLPDRVWKQLNISWPRHEQTWKKHEVLFGPAVTRLGKKIKYFLTPP